MIYVTSIDGNKVEPLINIGNDFKMDQDTDGTFLVSFSCFPDSNNPGYELLETESIITIEDNDFRVKQYRNNTHSKTITAVSIFYDLNKVQQHDEFSGNHLLQNHVDFAFNGTDWTAIIDDDIAQETNYIRSFGKENIISLVQKICKYHEIEYLILPDKKIHFKKEIGGDYDFQYRYKHNISSVVLKEDTTNLATIIKGFGANGLIVEVRSPNISIFGELEAEPVRDERFTDEQELADNIKLQLQDVPELAIESTIPELTEREIGERVWLLYEPLGIEMQTRILSQSKSMVNGKLLTSSVIFGNAITKTIEDTIIDQVEEMEESKKEFQSKFEQTDDRITLEVEQLEKSVATLEIKADNIELSVNNRITNEMAAINIRADQIESTVSAQNVSIGNLDNRVGSAESSITQQAWQISQKVSTTDYNGNTIASLINQTSTTVEIQAEKINMRGAVIVDGSIHGYTDIRVENDAYVGNNLNLGVNRGGSKAVNFGSGSNITYNGSYMELSSSNVRLNGSSNEMNGYNTIYGTLDVPYSTNLSGIVRAESSGIGISVSRKTLYVKVNGSTVGSVELT